MAQYIWDAMRIQNAGKVKVTEGEPTFTTTAMTIPFRFGGEQSGTRAEFIISRREMLDALLRMDSVEREQVAAARLNRERDSAPVV